MKKMPTIFERNVEDRSKLTTTYHADCQWVKDGEGIATKKYDGTCCLIKEGKLYKRREVKEGKIFPENFELVNYDPTTNKTIGWVPVTDDKNDRWHRETFEKYLNKLPDGTYELIGPKIQRNPEEIAYHALLKHSDASTFSDCPRDFEGLKEWFIGKDIEGVVFHHEDGRMAKIKKKDFGLNRKD